MFKKLLVGSWMMFLSVLQANANELLLTQGTLVARVSYFAASANNVFAKDGASSPIIPGLDDFPYAERSIVGFAQYGLSDNLTVFATLPMRRIFVHDSSFQHISTGIADIGVGATVKVMQEAGIVGSVTAGLNIPTPYPRDFAPPLGAGQVDIAISANAGKTFDSIPLDSQVSLGFRVRTGIYTSTVSSNPMLNADFQDHANYANEVFWNVETGWTFFAQLRVHAAVRGLASLRSDGTVFTLNRIPTTQSYHKLGAGASLKLLTHYDVFADVFSTFAGANTPGTIEIVMGAGVEF